MALRSGEEKRDHCPSQDPGAGHYDGKANPNPAGIRLFTIHWPESRCLYGKITALSQSTIHAGGIFCPSPHSVASFSFLLQGRENCPFLITGMLSSQLSVCGGHPCGGFCSKPGINAKHKIQVFASILKINAKIVLFRLSMHSFIINLQRPVQVNYL
jgi:hypothetical protein